MKVLYPMHNLHNNLYNKTMVSTRKGLTKLLSKALVPYARKETNGREF